MSWFRAVMVIALIEADVKETSCFWNGTINQLATVLGAAAWCPQVEHVRSNIVAKT